ncbi:MAG TPA: type VI secretion system baseplate subunit TssE [Gemmatimonadota bacterium]|nr:type VI secretion system baseplate subunit TssE [Gemmatimonadota bacterium]
MARKEADPVVQQSVLDRLIDEEPHTSGDRPTTWARSVQELKNALRRDLEWLLNTRRIVHTAPEVFTELRRSLYHYGLPDVSSLSADAPDTELILMRQIEEAIQLFEPRLSDVRVSRLPTERTARQVRFLIEGTLEMEPSPEEVAFDTVLEIASGRFEINA